MAEADQSRGAVQILVNNVKSDRKDDLERWCGSIARWWSG